MSQQKWGGGERERVREQHRSVMTMLKVGRSLMLSLSVFLAQSQHLTLSLSLHFLLSHVHTHHLSPPFSWLDKVSY